MKANYRDDLILPELSFRIVGCAFKVFKSIGPGLLEKRYQHAMAVELRNAGLEFQDQFRIKAYYEGEPSGYAILDFLVEDKIVVELKRGQFYFAGEVEQTCNYLKTTNKELGLILRFTDQGVRFKRVVNLEGYIAA